MFKLKFVVELKLYNSNILVCFSTYYGINFLEVNLTKSTAKFCKALYSVNNIYDSNNDYEKLFDIFSNTEYEKELLKLSNSFYKKRKSCIFTEIIDDDGNIELYSSELLNIETYFGKIRRSIKLKEILE